MSEEVVPPYAVLDGGLRDDLLQAMKYAYMRKGAFDANEMMGIEWRDDANSVNSTTWRYRINLGILANDPDITCSADGSWRHEQFIGGDDALHPGLNSIDANDNSYHVTLPDVSARFAEFERLIDDWVQPWVDNPTPNPNAFTNQINSLATVAKQLYAGTAPSTGAQGEAPISADPDLWDALTELDVSADNTSVTVDAFQRNYATDIWKTVAGQQCLVAAAGRAVTAEACAWNEAYRTLRDFLNLAKSDFLSYAGSSEGGGEALAARLGAASTVLGVLGAGIGIALPPFGAAMGLVGGVASVAALMVDPSAEVKATALALEGGDFDAMLDSFGEQIRAIEEDLSDAEELVATGCRRMVQDMRLNPDNYSLTRQPKRQGDHENFGRMLKGVIDLDSQKLRRTAGACELNAQHQLGLAGILSGNDAAGNPSSPVHDEFTRGVLPQAGTIGSGATGPLFEIQKLIDTAVDLLIDESKESHRVAEWLIGYTMDMHGTDRERESTLDRLASQIDDYGLSRGNDQNDPRSIS